MAAKKPKRKPAPPPKRRKLVTLPEPGPLEPPEPVRVEPTPGEVAGLLARSMTVHDAAKSTRAASARDLLRLREAYELRKQAIALDPARRDPAWLTEQVRTPVGTDTHDALMEFYREKLG